MTEDDGSRCFLVRPLPWMSDKIGKSFKILMNNSRKTKTQRADIRLLNVLIGHQVEGLAPPDAPSFALNNFKTVFKFTTTVIMRHLCSIKSTNPIA